MRITTEAVQFKADQKLLDIIEKKVRKLPTFFDRIQETRVTLKLENTGQVRDKIMELKVFVPGDILILKTSSKTFEAALDNAVQKMKVQLSRYKERLQER